MIKPSKIINDPVHGFIEVPRGLLLNLIDSPVFQRLRHIKQLGFSSIVYPGAVHTRFNHALGAMHLMRQALDVLRRKKVDISKKEYKAALAAILLHDIGHGPFSHALESAIIPGMHHEEMSLALMHTLNRQFRDKLTLAIEMFTGRYERGFFHQLVSSQLDMDRMDYLIRDSFFTGVAEGTIGTDRLIKILNVYEDTLVCEDKGLYSLEKFIVARRLMYWQVYLHKAALSAENMMVNALRRARFLFETGVPLDLDDTLRYFFRHQVNAHDLTDEVISRYISLDDSDIEFAIKKWQHHPDFVLSQLCTRLMNRRLLKISIQNDPPDPTLVDALCVTYAERHRITLEEARYFVFTRTVSNRAYFEAGGEPIMVWYKTGSIRELTEASDIGNIHALTEDVVKYYLCMPEELQGLVR
ncbi:MAG: HD domain-containing protein [Bacteroidia bacterium]|nr:HD domain-containing protein [Bacteroidia bacterium]